MSKYTLMKRRLRRGKLEYCGMRNDRKLLVSSLVSGQLTRARPESFRARSMGLWLVDRRPVLSKGGYSNGPGLNAIFTLVCPRSP